MNTSYSAVTLTLAALVFAGAGCSAYKVADKTAADLVGGAVGTPINALDKAKTLTADEQARLNREAEAIANEMTVALVLTENSEDPGLGRLGATFGCNDRIAFVQVPRETDSGDPIKDDLTALFALRDTNWRGYYNALAYSTLSVDKIQSRDGVTTEVWLTGELNSGGMCDDPRIKEQAEATVRRLRPTYAIYLNGFKDNWRCIGNESGQCEVKE